MNYVNLMIESSVHNSRAGIVLQQFNAESRQYAEEGTGGLANPVFKRYKECKVETVNCHGQAACGSRRVCEKSIILYYFAVKL